MRIQILKLTFVSFYNFSGFVSLHQTITANSFGPSRMPNKRVKCPHWRKMLHPISIFSVFWWDGKFWPPFFFFFTTINQNRVHAFRGHFCHLCTSVISCLSFSIRINFWSNDCFLCCDWKRDVCPRFFSYFVK